MNERLSGPWASDEREKGAARGLNVALVSNQTAGRCSPERIRRLRRAFETAECRVHAYDSRAFSLERLPPHVDLVCIAGGDGTVRMTIGSSRDRTHPVPYCVFPLGTINLLAREAGYRADFKGFSPAMIARSDERTHFAGRIGEESFLCCASIGPDSHAVAQVCPRLKARIGRLAYVAAMAKLLWAWPRQRLQLEIDGAQHAAEAVFILKGRYYAGPWQLDEKARLTRDRFRVLLLPRARRLDVARLVLATIFGRRFADPQWVRLDARVVDVAGADAVPIQADGDIIATTPARIEMDPRPMIFRCGSGAAATSQG